MDKVKIQRKKRNVKKAGAKEKILSALGVGSALLGLSAAGVAKPKNPIVRVMNKANPLSAKTALAAEAEVETEEGEDVETEETAEPAGQPASGFFQEVQAAETIGTRGPEVYTANNELTAAEDLDLSVVSDEAPPVVAENRQTSRAPLDSDQSYKVVKGDTLWDLAVKYYGDGTKWHKILEANPGKIPNDNPRLLQIGTILVIPKI